MDEAVVPSFVTAAEWFADLAGREQVVERWSDSSVLPGYTIGGLVGHVIAAVAWLEPLLDAPAADESSVISLGQYYQPLAIRKLEDLDTALHSRLRDQGEHGGKRGPSDSLGKLRAHIDRLRERLADETIGRVVDLRPALPTSIRLDDLLRTRAVELVVHGDDLAVSVGLDEVPPPGPAAVTINALLATAREANGDLEVIRALARGDRATARVTPVL